VLVTQAVPDRVVTPEAVVLEFETAGIGSRVPATILDSLIQAALGIALLLLGTFLIGVTGGFGVAFLLIALPGLVFGYPIGFETLWRGRTPGKAALGLRVVTVEGAPVRFRHAAIRGVLSIVDIQLSQGAVAILFILFTRRNQRLGDLLAGTIVLRERSGVGRPSAVTFTAPPGLEALASTLDTTALTHEDYGAVRSLLLRASTMPPNVRDQLARQLADIVLARLRVPAPSGIPAEVFLVCVAAAYQARARPDTGPAAALGGGHGASVWSDVSWPRPTSTAPAPPASLPSDGFVAPD
jgi:uncharacterized RDD family membrane protein YckC